MELKNQQSKELKKATVFMKLATIISELSNCTTRNVGAILIKENMIISTGYNGTPKGVLDCNKGGCDRCNLKKHEPGNLFNCICVHAETNAIIQAAYNGISTKNSVMFCTTKPCNDCLKMLINAGVKKIIYLENYPIVHNKKLLSKIEVIKYDHKRTRC